MSYKDVHTALATVAVLAGYKAPKRAGRVRDVSARQWHNTYMIEPADEGAKILTAGMVKRDMKLGCSNTSPVQNNRRRQRIGAWTLSTKRTAF